MKRFCMLLAAAGLVALALILIAVTIFRPLPQRDFEPPDGAIVTYFAAPRTEVALPLIVSGSMEPGFMRPFMLAFQRHNPDVSIAYIQSRSGAFLERALDACHRNERAADLYLSASTDQFVRLANENCAATLPSTVGGAAPAHAQWRNQVVAFAVEPAVFVFARRPDERASHLPASHIALLDWLRTLPAGSDRVGTYDIEASADGYNFAAADSRQPSLYGRLIEGLGRARVRLYCCSNVMVDAIDRGDIRFAYNVQLSYAYAAQRAGSRISVILPNDFQALQTVSLMMPKGARSSPLAERMAAFLVSDEAREIARQNLAQPGVPRAVARTLADRLLGEASVTPLLLSLQDSARRRQLIQEWRQAILGSAPPTGQPRSSPPGADEQP